VTCGDHDDLECESVLRDVWLFLDDELDPEHRAAVRKHLDDCSPCLEEAGIDRKLKLLLSRTCGGDRAPEQLRTRLLASMGVIQVESQTADGTVVTRVDVTTVSVTLDDRDGPPSN
jgi:mycothiol system anti-sigma-R factor